MTLTYTPALDKRENAFCTIFLFCRPHGGWSNDVSFGECLWLSRLLNRLCSPPRLSKWTCYALMTMFMTCCRNLTKQLLVFHVFNKLINKDLWQTMCRFFTNNIMNGSGAVPSSQRWAIGVDKFDKRSVMNPMANHKVTLNFCYPAHVTR